VTGKEPVRRWAPDDLRHLAGLRELEIAAPTYDGRPGPWTPIWVVVVGELVYVRTWQRRDTGWYGRAVASGRSRIRVSGAVVDVTVTVSGDADADAVDTAYRAKYGAGGRSMATAEAAASTLRLTRVS
jgi:hypothetical protein